MAQKHNADYAEKPMTRDGRLQGPSRRYRRLRNPNFTAAEWAGKNPLLQRGEIGIEIDTNRMKAGNGYTLWNDLPYMSETVATWGSIGGDINDQADLINMVGDKVAAEATARENADVALGARIDGVINDLSAETTARENADLELQNQINTNKDTMDGHIANTSNPHQVTKAQVGLSNVDNTADLDKPISTATQTALDGKQNVSTTNYQMGNASGGWTAMTNVQQDALNSGATTTNISQIATNTATIAGHMADTNNPHSVTKTQVGLGNVDNTSDLNKPISTATQAALDTKAPLDTYLAPNFDGLTPIATYEFDTSSTSFYKLLTFNNIYATTEDIPVARALFRITATVGGKTSVINAIVETQKALTYMRVLSNHTTGYAAAGSTGVRYMRSSIPKALNDGNDWELDVNAYNATARHIKVEVFQSDNGFTWFANGSVSTITASTHTSTNITYYTTQGTIIHPVLNASVTSATLATYIAGRLPKLIPGTMPVAGAALLANQFCFMSNSLVYPATENTVPINTGFGLAVSYGAVASGAATTYYQILQKYSVSSLSNIPHDTLERGAPCFFRCTMDANGNIKSDNYVATEMTAGYTWYYVGVASSATAIMVDTTSSVFLTLDANGKLTHVNGKKCNAEWGNIAGTITDQTDLQNALDGKQAISASAYNMGNASGGWTAMTAAQQNALNSGATTTNIGQIATNTTSIANEIIDRQNADNGLQTQIDAIVSKSDVVDIVGTYAELQAYDTSALGNNDVVKVISDSTHNNAPSYYRWVITGGVGAWVYIGSESETYTKAETDALLNDKQDVITDLATIRAGAALGATALQSGDNVSELVNDAGYLTQHQTLADLGITATASEINVLDGITASTAELNYTDGVTSNIQTQLNGKQATISDLATIRSGATLGATAVQPSDLATVATSGSYNDLSNKPTIPAAQVNSDWNANSGVAQILNKPTLGTAAAADTTDFATAAQGAKADTAVQPADLATVATTGQYSDLNGKPTIPTVNDPTITITQDGVTKGSFSLNQATGDTIALDAGGSVNIDNLTITENTSQEIQAVATVNANTASGATNPIYNWVGTLAQWEAQDVANQHPDWICFITDDAREDWGSITDPVGLVEDWGLITQPAD